MKTNSIIENMKKKAASNNLTIRTMDSCKKGETKKEKGIAVNWEEAYRFDSGK